MNLIEIRQLMGLQNSRNIVAQNMITVIYSNDFNLLLSSMIIEGCFDGQN